ncbi:hypothetical protein BHE74_00024074 [Ensete ventricosum]|nr:hypothetical protein BHE74_00024074 [Ensete ventricosum]
MTPKDKAGTRAFWNKLEQGKKTVSPAKNPRKEKETRKIPTRSKHGLRHVRPKTPVAEQHKIRRRTKERKKERVSSAKNPRNTNGSTIKKTHEGNRKRRIKIRETFVPDRSGGREQQPENQTRAMREATRSGSRNGGRRGNGDEETGKRGKQQHGFCRVLGRAEGGAHAWGSGELPLLWERSLVWVGGRRPSQVSSKNPTFERLKATLVLGGGAGENAEGSTFPGLGRFPAFALPGLWPRAGSSFASALSPRCVAADGPAVASPLVFWSSTLHLFCFFFIPALPCFAFGLQWIWLVEGNGDDVEAGGGGGFGGGTAAVGNPDDAAQENSGKGIVEPCICLVQSGRACNPNMGLFFLSLSCI